MVELKIKIPEMQEKVQAHIDGLNGAYGAKGLSPAQKDQLTKLFNYLDKVIREEHEGDSKKATKVFEAGFNYAKAVFEVRNNIGGQSNIDSAKTALQEELQFSDRRFNAGVQTKIDIIVGISKAEEVAAKVDGSLAEDNEKLSQFFGELLKASGGDFAGLLESIDSALPEKISAEDLSQPANFGDSLTEISKKSIQDGKFDAEAFKSAIEDLTDIQKAKISFQSQFTVQSLSFAKNLGEKLEPVRFAELSAAIEAAGKGLPETREGQPRSLELNAYLAQVVKQTIEGAETLAKKVGGDFDYAGFYKDTITKVIDQLSENEELKGKLSQEDLKDLKTSIDFAANFKKADGNKKEQAGVLSGFMKSNGGMVAMFLLTIAAEPLSRFFGMFGALGRPVQALLSQANQHASSLVTATVMGCVMNRKEAPPAAAKQEVSQ